MPESIDTTTVTDTTDVARTEERMRKARAAALSAAHDDDLEDALDQVQGRLACGVPMRAVLIELWRAGCRTGYFEATGPDHDRVEALTHLETYIAEQLAGLGKAA